MSEFVSQIVPYNLITLQFNFLSLKCQKRTKNVIYQYRFHILKEDLYKIDKKGLGINVIQNSFLYF